jgi:hypothetical protein
VIVVGMTVVKMLVIMGMHMVVAVRMGMGVSMGYTIVGVLVGVAMFMIMAVIANMILVNMHNQNSFDFFFIITEK